MKEYKVKEVGVSGSYVRRTQGGKSDVDILVDFSEVPSLLRFVHLENYLSDLLGVKVDLVMKNSLKHHIGQAILRELSFFEAVRC